MWGVPKGEGASEGLEELVLWSYMDALKFGSSNGSLSGSVCPSLLISYSVGWPMARYLSICECLMPIAVGAGDTTSLALPYLPGNADIKSGDILMSSGLGGVFPAGYPVARVTEVHRDAVQPLALVRAIPFATIDTDTEVMLVWFREDHPASPTPASTPAGDLRTGNSKLQPQAAPPPRPKAQNPETPPTAAPPAGSGARISEPSSGTVNPAAPTPSKSGAPATVTSPRGSTPAAPPNSKDSVPGDNPRAATPRKPAPPATPEPSPDATPRNQ